MATEGQLSSLRKIASEIKTIDKDKLLRPSLGEASIKEAFGDRFDRITQKLEFAIEFAPHVHDSQLSSLNSHFQQIVSYMQSQAGLDTPQYVAQRDTFLKNIDSQLEQLRQYWPPFVTAAVEARGFLQDEGIRKEYQRTIDSMKEESASALKLVKDEASKTIEEARVLAKQIEEKARRTAAHISVDAAQEQFRLAQEDLRKQVKLWTVLAVLAVGGFFAVACWLAQIELPKDRDL